MRAVEEFLTYIANNQVFIPNYGERDRQGDRISTAFIESAVNDVVAKRFTKRQQMQWCAKKTDSNSGAENPLDRIVKICKATGESHPISWLCQQFGGFFVKNPPQAKLQNTPVVRVTQVILKEFSEVLDAVSHSLDNDGQIDIEEAKRIRCEWETLKAATEGFVVSCEHGVYVESE